MENGQWAHGGKLSLVEEGEVAHPTDHEGVGVAVVTDIVDMALTDVAEVAGTQGEGAQGYLYAEEVAAGEGVEGVRDADIVVVVPEREDLVVALTVAGAEHEAQEGDIKLVAGTERLAPQAEIVDGHGRCREAHGDECLRGVVAVAGVVEETHVGAHLRTEEEAEGGFLKGQASLWAERMIGGLRIDEVEMPGGVEANVAAEGASSLGLVLGVGKIALHEGLKGDRAVGQMGRAQSLVHEMKLRSVVFERREVAVELVDAAHAEEHGMEDRRGPTPKTSPVGTLNSSGFLAPCEGGGLLSSRCFLGRGDATANEQWTMDNEQ